MSIFWTIFFFLLGLAVLIKGADFFVDGSAGLARKLRVSDFFIGVTLVALGTSLPEFMVSLIAGFSHSSELVIGNIIGSNIANIALILGICGIIRVVKIKPDTLAKRDIPFIILSGIILLILGFDRIFQNHGVNFNRLTIGDGLILLSFFIIFLFYIYADFKSSRSLEAAVEEKEKIHAKESLLRLLIMIFGGLFAVIGGGKLVVDNAISLAALLGVSQSIIGLTIVAVGTSLPEAVTTIVAFTKRNEEIAVGNIIGSNTLNVFFVLGVVATFTPLELSAAMMVDMMIMITVSILLFFIGYFRKEIGKLSGVAFLAYYAAYMIFIVLREAIAK